MRKHISDLYIGKYRGINDLEIRDCNYINIFTGKNNAGKTSILELLSIISNPLSLKRWVSICYDSRSGGKSIYTEITRMFPLYDSEKRIEFNYTLESSEHRFHADAKENDSSVPQSELMRLNGYIKTGAQKPKEDEMLDMKYLSVHIRLDENEITDGVYEEQNRIDKKTDIKDSIPVVFISTSRRLDGYKYLLKQIINSKKSIDAIVRILKKFDDSITGISMVDNECLVYSNKGDVAVPIAVYGDGVKKAIYLFAAVIFAKDGIVLIDEFETSIHNEVMADILEILFEAASEYNVQFFMTTHSQSAIEKIAKMKELLDQINIYTLYNKSDYAVRRLSGNDITNAHELGVVLL